MIFEADDSIVPASTPSVSQRRSWIAVDVNTPGTFDLSNVLAETSGPNDLAPTLIDDLGAPGNWVLRAAAVPVPEPSSLVLVVVGAGLLMVRRLACPGNSIT